MMLTRDYYNKINQSKLFLANPQKKYINILSGVKDLKLTINFNKISEFSFKIYEYDNGIKNSLYDKVINKRLIELQYIGWFQIQNIRESNNGIVSYKEVECLSLENELVGKRIYDINGVFALYDFSDQENSLLHIISKETGWKIGHVDNELLTKWRTFSIDSAKVYNFLTQDVSKSFDCIFKFDTYEKTINAYLLENVGELTDIIISRKNILQQYIKESDSDDIITKLKVLGADGVDIRAVNPSGTNYLINVDYFKTTEWMTQGLIDALNNYQTVYNSNMNQYTNKLSVLKQKQQELTILKAELIDLESQKTAEDYVVGSYINLYGTTPPIGSQEYTLYLQALNKRDSYIIQIQNKKSEIKSKENEITILENELKDINFTLEISNYFTEEQINELNIFLTENEEYQDSTFVITDEMSEEEIIELKLELMQNGIKELARASQPQFSINISASNLYTVVDDKMGLSYKKWCEKLQLGNLLTVKFRDDYYATVRILQINFDFNKLNDIELVLSDKSRIDDKFIQLGELQADAGRSASTISLNKYGWDKAKNQTNEVREFINGTFDATKNAMQNNDNQETYFDTYGWRMRRWLPDQNKYSDYQSWWNSNTLLFTSDGWKSVQTAIGLLTAPDGQSYYGVATDVLVGNLIIGSKLNITNNAGNYIIDNNGFSATATVGSNTYSVGINPSTPADIFKISINGHNQFYIDTISNKLRFSGEIFGGSININNRFKVDSEGNVTLPPEATIKWEQIEDGETWVTQITRNTVTTEYVNSLNVKAGSVDCENLTGNIITGKKIVSGEFRNDQIFIDNNTIQFAQGGSIKRSSSNSWSQSNRYLDNVISFGSQDIQIGQYSGNYVNVLNIPMRTINIGYSGSYSYSSINMYTGAGFYLYISSNSFLRVATSSSYPFFPSLIPNSRWNLGLSNYPWGYGYFENIIHTNSNGTIGYFGKSPVTQKTVSKLSTSADINAIRSKVNEILDVFGNSSGYGLIKL